MRQALGIAVVMAMLVTPAMAALYVENFNYPDGNLEGVGGWSGGTGSQVTVSGGRALLTYDDSVRGTTINQILPTPIGGDKIWWHASVFSGGTAIDGNAFDLRLEDPEGDPFARWYGGAYWERPRIGDLGIVLGNAVLTEGIWNDLLVVIDTVAKKSTFSLNGVELGTLDYSSSTNTGNTVGRIRMGFQNATTAQNGAIKYYDNIWVTDIPEPATLALLALGGLFAVRRRARA